MSVISFILSLAAATTIFAGGDYVRIAVDSTSVYRIPHSTLREWGFDDPQKVRVFGHGSYENAHELDTVAAGVIPAVASSHIDGALYFYGEGSVKITPVSEKNLDVISNYYSDGSCYFLTATAGDGATVASVEPTVTAGTEAVGSHLCIDYRRTEERNYGFGSVHFFSRDISRDPSGLDFRFTMTDAAEGESATAGFRYVYLHGQSTAQRIDAKFTGDVTAESFTTSTHTKNDALHRLFSRSTLKTVTLTANNPTESRFTLNMSAGGGNFSLLAASDLFLTYRRLNRMRGEAMEMTFIGLGGGVTPVEIAGVNERTRIWDVTEPRAAVELTRKPAAATDAEKTGTAAEKTGAFWDYDRLTVALPASKLDCRRIVAFNPGEGIPTPRFDGRVEATDLTAMESVDYLIVAPRKFMAEARELAAIHRELNGIKAAAVCQDDIFNQYSSGKNHPNAVRKFVKALHERTDRPLTHLLMFGQGTYDPRGLVEPDVAGGERLTCYQTERFADASDETSNYASDIYFGITAERIDERLPLSAAEASVAVGRAPVRTAGEAENFVRKSERWLRDPRSAGRPDLAIVSCCYGDADGHLNQSENICGTIGSLAPSTTCAKIYNALYPAVTSTMNRPHEAMMRALGRRPGYINYTGHSGASDISSTLTQTDVRGAEFTSAPICFLAGCETATVDLHNRGIGAEFLLNPGGPTAVVASAKTVYMNHNHRLNDEFVKAVFAPDGAETVGEAWLKAFNNSGKDNVGCTTNNLSYNLLGDPALPLRRPDRAVTVTAIGDGAPADGVGAEISSLTPVRIQGTITRGDGSRDTEFDGEMILTIHDTATETTANRHDSSDSEKRVTLDETPLFETEVEVRGGEWAATITAPLTSRAGTHRLTMAGWSDRHVATGKLDGVTIALPAEGTAAVDCDGPEISLTINGRPAIDGEETTADVTIGMTVTDAGGSGVSVNGGRIGAAVRGWIDGKPISGFGNGMTVDADGTATVSHRPDSMEDGEHILKVTARDIAGNSRTESVRFTVVSSPIEARLDADRSIVGDAVELTLTHRLSAEAETRLVIRDLTGNTVMSVPGAAFPYSWDFRDGEGRMLPDGVYRASVILRDGNRLGATQETKFTLLRKTSAE